MSGSKAFVSLKPGVDDDPKALRRELTAHARRRLGPAVAPREIEFSDDLPKTRSGKIMRRLLKARELGLPEGDLSTLETPGGDSEVSDSVELLRSMLRVRRFEERCVELYSQTKIRGFLHVYIGEEAVATGSCPNSSPMMRWSRYTASTVMPCSKECRRAR